MNLTRGDVEIVPYDVALHRADVVALWVTVFGYETAHNEPALVLQKKQAVDDGLFFVARVRDGRVIGTVMCGYDGHRGWIYSLAVAPELQRSGVGTLLMEHAEHALQDLGCMKINLQIVAGNERARRFYETLGFRVEARVSMGKRIERNITNATQPGVEDA